MTLQRVSVDVDKAGEQRLGGGASREAIRWRRATQPTPNRVHWNEQVTTLNNP